MYRKVLISKGNVGMAISHLNKHKYITMVGMDAMT